MRVGARATRALPRGLTVEMTDSGDRWLDVERASIGHARDERIEGSPGQYTLSCACCGTFSGPTRDAALHAWMRHVVAALALQSSDTGPSSDA